MLSTGFTQPHCGQVAHGWMRHFARILPVPLKRGGLRFHFGFWEAFFSWSGKKRMGRETRDYAKDVFMICRCSQLQLPVGILLSLSLVKKIQVKFFSIVFLYNYLICLFKNEICSRRYHLEMTLYVT